MRRGLSLVRRQIYVESPPLPARRRTGGHRPCAGLSCPCDRHHGRRTAALSARHTYADPARQRIANFSRNVGHASVQRPFRLGVPLAQTAATAAGRSLPAGARVEGDRRAGGRPAMGRTERRPRRRRLPALPPTRMERLRTDDAAAGRICEGPSAVEHLDPDAQIHAPSLPR